MAEGQIHWFYVNLDRSADRRTSMEASLDALGLPFTRVPAVDGSRLTFPIPGVDRALYRRAHGREVRLAEVGCYLSHLKVMQTFLSTPYAYAMVLEDDAVVTSDAVRLPDALTSPGIRDTWDVVKFEAHHPSAGLPIRRLFGAYRLCALAMRPTGSAAYLVNRKAAAAYLAHLLPMRVPYDHAFDRGWAMGLKVRAVMPLPIRPDGGLSTISTPDAPHVKVKLWRKAPTLMWRTGTETMRVVSALHAWAFPKRAFPLQGSARRRAVHYDDVAESIADPTPR